MIQNKDNPVKRNKGFFLKRAPVFIFLFFLIQGFITVPFPGFTGIRQVFAETEKNGPGLTDEAGDKSDILAEVEGKPVTALDLLSRYNLFLVMSRYPASYRENLTINSYLNNYIAEILLLKKAGETGLEAGDEEIEKEKKEYLERNNLTEEKLLKNLQNAGLSMEDADLYFKNNILITRLGSKRLGDIKIPDQDARKFYSDNIDYYIGPEKVTLSHILICHKDSNVCSSDLSRKEAKELALKIRENATPENFSRLAKQYSADKTGANGGYLGEITKGTAVAPIDRAAFSLEKGKISDVVETDYGYHILHVTNKQEARSLSFEDAKGSVIEILREEMVASELLKYSRQLLQSSDIKKYSAAERKGHKPDAGQQAQNAKTFDQDKKFPTFKTSEDSICSNSEGKPVIILFTRIGCSFCEWISETYDSTVMEYIEMGLIEAHHYDMTTKDDLLTPEKETEIPEEHQKLFDRDNPERSTPNFVFGCKYRRLGLGYFSQDDLFAEEMEMRQVIDFLLNK